jgi:hypothetical protein
MGLTTDKLIEHIKRRVSVPDSQIKYNNIDFVAFLNNAIESKIVPQLIAIDEDFFVTYKDIPLVANQSSYRLPNMAVCWAVHEIGYLDSAGNYNRLDRMMRGTELVNTTSNQPYGMMIRDGNIITTPNMGSTVNGSLRVYYYRRLNELTLLSNCGKITNVLSAAPDYIITCDNAPIGLGTGADFIKGTSPYELDIINASVTVVGVTVNVAQSLFTSAPEIGDYIAPTGFTPIPHLPDAWHYILADFGARKCLIGNADEKVIALLDTDIGDDLNGIKQVVKNRAKGSPKKRVSRNPILALGRGHR